MEFILIWLMVVVEKISIVLMNGWYIFMFSFAAACIISAAALVNADLTYDEDRKERINSAKALTVKCFTKAKFWMITGILLWAVGCILPNQKEMAMIIAGGVTYNIITSDAAKEVGGKSLQLLNKKLDELLTEEEKKELVQKQTNSGI